MLWGDRMRNKTDQKDKIKEFMIFEQIDMILIRLVFVFRLIPFSQISPTSLAYKLCKQIKAISQYNSKDITIMSVPKPQHSGIIVRNFLTVFVVISLMVYIHIGLNQATSTLTDANAIVKSILNNETYSITQERLFNLKQSLKEKSYHELAQSECLVKIYLDVLNNQLFVDESKDKNAKQAQQSTDKVELKFNELIFPTVAHSLEGFRNCSDILTLMNFLNPNKTDFIYTKFMQQKYGAFIQDSQNQSKREPTKEQTKFCIFTNQFNTSTTKLRQNINSIIDQSYEDYKLIILDNGSTDGSYEIAKVILNDLKGKLTSENSKEANLIDDKYQIIKEESKLGIWELYDRHEQACEESDFVVFIDGRDSLPTRHTLNILNKQIVSRKEKPWMITAPMLKRKQISRQAPVDFTVQTKLSSIPTYTFKIMSKLLLKQNKAKLKQLTVGVSHSFQVQKATVQILSEYIKQHRIPVLQTDEMMYVYDTIENKQVERNEYFVAVVKKQLASRKNEQKK